MDVKRSVGAYQKTSMPFSAFFFSFFFSPQTERREPRWPADGSCSPTRGDRHLGRGERSDGGGRDDEGDPQ